MVRKLLLVLVRMRGSEKKEKRKGEWEGGCTREIGRKRGNKGFDVIITKIPLYLPVT